MAAGALLDRVAVLVAQLRGDGIDVATAAHIDAVNALDAVPIDDVSLVRAVLRATLVKQPDPDGVFDRAFARTMLVADPAASPAASGTDVGGNEPSVLAARIADAMSRGAASELDALARQAIDVFAGLDVAGRGERYHLARTLRALDLSRLVGAAMRRLRAGGEGGELELGLKRAELSRLLAEFRKLLALEIATRRVRPDTEAPGSSVDARDRDLAELLPFELAEVRRAVRPLARALAARAAHHRRLRTSGRLDARRTIRRSLEAGGVPLDVRYRSRHPHRPDLVVLCDVSGSVAEFAQFTFMLVSALHSELRSVRSFAFVDGVAEVTDLFQQAVYDLDVRRLLERRGLVALDGRSDYGCAFGTFAARHIDAVSPRTTVLVCGDARSNDRPSGADALRRIAAAARRVYWLNPEPVAEWSQTGSVIDEYRPSCRAVFEVRTLRQLGDAVATIL